MLLNADGFETGLCSFVVEWLLFIRREEVTHARVVCHSREEAIDILKAEGYKPFSENIWTRGKRQAFISRNIQYSEPLQTVIMYQREDDGTMTQVELHLGEETRKEGLN